MPRPGHGSGRGRGPVRGAAREPVRGVGPAPDPTPGNPSRQGRVSRGMHANMARVQQLLLFFLWLAENIATYLGAWRHPHQLHGWQPVALEKFGSWALLISVTFVIVAATRGQRSSR